MLLLSASGTNDNALVDDGVDNLTVAVVDRIDILVLLMTRLLALASFCY